MILVLWGAAMHALEAIRSLVTSTPTPFELIIVENASPEASGALVRATTSGARFIANPHNLGFGPAVNQAARLARSHVLVFINPDLTFEPGWLQPLLDTLEADPCVAMVSALLRNSDGSIQDAGRTVDASGFTHADADAMQSITTAPTRPVTVQYASGACVAVRADDFARVGGFDEQFVPAYFEDVDLCLRLGTGNRYICVDPRSSVVHIGGVSTAQRSRQEMFDRNRRRFTAKWQAELARLPAAR